jgi:hypothetical protein
VAQSLGRPCAKCGADEWGARKERPYCAPCDRKKSALRAASSGGAQRLLDKAKERAKKQNVDFSITLDDVKAAWPADGKCPALGIELKRGVGKMQDSSPTLDRLNPMWGYTPTNIAVLSLAANRIKSNGRASELERIAAWMRSRGLD